MSDSTPSASLPYPEDEDLPEASTHLRSLAIALDTLTIPRFSGAAARDSAIPAPTNGQAAYEQGEEQLKFYKSGYGSWMPTDYPTLRKVKTSDQSISGTAFQVDTHLSGLVYKANTTYLINGWFNYTSMNRDRKSVV